MYKTLKSVDMFASSVFTGNWVFKFSGEVLEGSPFSFDSRRQGSSVGMGRVWNPPG